MIVGEAPGFNEDQAGEPFVGAAGHLLDRLLEEIEIDRSAVYLTNVIKCRAPNDRVPQAEEVDACKGYLLEQMKLIEPKVVVALGGGAVTQEENWQTIRASGGLVICLAAAVDTILTRVERKDDRPLLAGLNTAEKRAKIERMLAERAPFYERADLTLTTSESISPDATAQEATECVLALIEERDAVS